MRAAMLGESDRGRTTYTRRWRAAQPCEASRRIANRSPRRKSARFRRDARDAALMDAAIDKDLPLRRTRACSGRVLGDVLRAQTGEAGFARIEAIRQTAIRFRRAEHGDAGAVTRRARRRCSTRCRSRTCSMSCARSAISRISPTSPRTCTRTAAGARTRSRARRRSAAASRSALDALAAAGVDGADDRPLVRRRAGEPGADRASDRGAAQEHPRRRARDRAAAASGATASRSRPTRPPSSTRRLHRQVLALWQTAMLRLSKLQVNDEIDNGLAYYRYTFLDADPAARTPTLEARLAHDFAARWRRGSPPFLRTGSWIGGDRDGNPFVTADTLAYAIARAGGASRSRTTSTKSTGWAPSCRCRRGSCSRRRRCSRWRRTRTTTNPHRHDEPYRQALIGIYARLAATARALAGYVPPRPPHASTGAPYATPAELRADLDDRSPRRSRRTARRRSRRGGSIRCCAPSTCSASTSPCSTCARTPTCTRRSSASCSRGRA